MWIDVIGYVGLGLVFASFIIKRWTWLYTLNAIGATLLTIYAYLIGNHVFTILEGGLAAYLVARICSEYRARSSQSKSSAYRA